MKHDIRDKDDVKLLIDEFYIRLTRDKEMNYIFNEVDQINWEHHLPIICAFWESSLFGKMGYVGNPMDAHFKLNQKIKLTAAHFNFWKMCFIETVEDYFEGEVANEAKKRAVSIADLMFYKIQNYHEAPSVKIKKDNNK